MTHKNAAQMPKTPVVMNQIVAVAQEKNPPIMSRQQWLIVNKDKLPPSYSEDFDYIASECYQGFVRLHQHDFNRHVQPICLAENNSLNHQVIESIWLTLQTTDFAGTISLILADDYNEIKLARLTDIHLVEPIVPAYHTRKIDLFTLTPELDHVCLNPKQALCLRVVLTDNILIRSKVLA